MPTRPRHSDRKGKPVSVVPVTPDQALGALLKVKPADVKKLEAAEEKGGKKR